MSKSESGLFKNTVGAGKSETPNTNSKAATKASPMVREAGSYKDVHGYPISNEYVPADHEDLMNQCHPISKEKTIAITTNPDTNTPVWLETGNENAGLNHIMKHRDGFNKHGIATKDIPDLIMTAVSKGTFLGYSSQSKSAARVYDVKFNNKDIRVMITIGSNGFIVQSNIFNRSYKINEH